MYSTYPYIQYNTYLHIHTDTYIHTSHLVSVQFHPAGLHAFASEKRVPGVPGKIKQSSHLSLPSLLSLGYQTPHSGHTDLWCISPCFPTFSTHLRAWHSSFYQLNPQKSILHLCRLTLHLSQSTCLD